MKIKILGTAAAEGWPGVFCGCRTCRRARELGGKNLRSRASVQIGSKHKIDLPPDTWHHIVSHGLDLSTLEHLFITHSHEDHLAADQLEYLSAPFAHRRSRPLRIHGTDAVLSIAEEHLGHGNGNAAVLIELEPFKTVEAGDLSFTPIAAAHKPGEVCLNYVVVSERGTFLYASDTGWYGDETWNFLESARLDCVIAECTSGPNRDGVGHLDFDSLFAMKRRLEDSGAFNKGVFVATHFSHNVGLMHEELEQILAARGIQTAYDGMELAV